jgi:hypothetical protein
MVVLGSTLVLGAVFAAGARVGYGYRAARADREALAASQEALAAVRDASQGDARTALAMAGVRQDLARHAGAIEAAVASQPIVREVERVVDGKKVVCRERDAVRYRELFNAAVTGTEPAAARGVH